MNLDLLPDDYIEQARQRAYRYQGQWTGTSGSLAADSARLLLERKRLLNAIHKLLQQLYAASPSLRRAIDNPGLGSISIDDSGDGWEGVRQRHEDMHQRIREGSDRVRIIGLSGRAGSGKTTVAGMIPAAVVIQLADPLYAALSTMLGVPESMLRSPAYKERPFLGLGKSPRQMMQTLGTEWGRELIDRHIWIRLLEKRIETLRAQGVRTIVVADVRFENEADAIRRMDGQVWRVRRDEPATASAHSSECGVGLEDDEPEIVNTGTLDDLRGRVLEALGVVA